MDTISQLAFYTIGLTVFFIVAWILETIYFAITGRDKPVERIKMDYKK
jgi:hypothetical protein